MCVVRNCVEILVLCFYSFANSHDVRAQHETERVCSSADHRSGERAAFRARLEANECSFLLSFPLNSSLNESPRTFARIHLFASLRTNSNNTFNSMAVCCECSCCCSMFLFVWCESTFMCSLCMLSSEECLECTQTRRS